MATSKRKSSRGTPRPARAVMHPAAATISAAPQPNTQVSAPASHPAERSLPESLQAERAAFRRQRLLVGALVVAVAAGLLIAALALGAGLGPAAEPLPAATSVPAATAAPAIVAPTAAPAIVAPTAAPAIVAPTAMPTVAAPTAVPTAAAPTAAPTVAAPTAAPAAQAAPAAPAAQAAPAAPAAQANQPAAVVASCVAIAGMPVFAGATCVDYDMDEDDGVIEHQNTYTSGASVDEVRRFYEAAFAANGWTVVEFDQDIEDNTYAYTVAQQLRRVKVKVEPELTPSGPLTEITIDED